MSATNRGRERIDADYYPTPAWCVRSIVERFGSAFPRAGIVEPCCGDGAIIRAAGAQRFALGIDIRAECAEQVAPLPFMRADIREVRAVDVFPAVVPSLLMTNPPFSLAFEIAQHVRREWPSVPYLMLMRLSFLESEERAEWLRSDMPDVYVLPHRPSFAFGSTDSASYAWFHWRTPAGLRVSPMGRVEVLPTVPASMRDKAEPRPVVASQVSLW